MLGVYVEYLVAVNYMQVERKHCGCVHGRCMPTAVSADFIL